MDNDSDSESKNQMTPTSNNNYSLPLVPNQRLNTTSGPRKSTNGAPSLLSNITLGNKESTSNQYAKHKRENNGHISGYD